MVGSPVLSRRPTTCRWPYKDSGFPTYEHVDGVLGTFPISPKGKSSKGPTSASSSNSRYAATAPARRHATTNSINNNHHSRDGEPELLFGFVSRSTEYIRGSRSRPKPGSPRPVGSRLFAGTLRCDTDAGYLYRGLVGSWTSVHSRTTRSHEAKVHAS